MSDRLRYMVYRSYPPSERPEPDEQIIFYGWTRNKDLLKAFFQQRDHSKYICKKMYDDEITYVYDELLEGAARMIDVLPLKSAKDRKEYTFITTLSEMQEAEFKIQRLIHDIPSLKNFRGDGNYMEIAYNLKPKWKNLLEKIGYQIPEFDELFPYADYHDDPTDIRNVEEEIMTAYDHTEYLNGKIPGLETIKAQHMRQFYSLELFVRVLSEDL